MNSLGRGRTKRPDDGGNILWRREGGRILHIVDLDGAFAGLPKNRQLIQEMVAAVGDMPVQVGGGIRSLEIIEAYLQVGVSRVIVGTKAIEDFEFLVNAAERFPQQILLGLDARNGAVATHGWDEDSGISALAFARKAAALPIAGIVYTDIDRDGMMSGVNVDATVALAQGADVGVVASGGIATLQDLLDTPASSWGKGQFYLLILIMTGGIDGGGRVERRVALALAHRRQNMTAYC